VKCYSGEGIAFMVRVASNNSMQRTSLRAAADAERWPLTTNDNI
jgi:hypothetical protein